MFYGIKFNLADLNTTRYSIFNESLNKEIFHLQPCHFAHNQTEYQIAITSIFRQLNLIFDIVNGLNMAPHKVLKSELKMM